MATLKQIAAAAGVSVTQASRALGGHHDVSRATRDRVRAAADQLGYHPNRAARALVSGRSGLVAMVVPAPDAPPAEDPLFEIVMGLSAEFTRRDLHFVLHVLQPGEDAAEAHERLWRGGGIDGFVVIQPKVSDPRIARLADLGAAFVVHGASAIAGSAPRVDIDNGAAAFDLVRAARESGHDHILFLNGPEDQVFAAERRKGALRAGLDADAISHGPMLRRRGREEAATALTTATPPTAIIAGNTFLAEGVYAAAADLGLSIPMDLSVLAHDDALSAHDPATFTPPLTGTRAPLADAWAPIADRLSGVSGSSAGSLHRLDMSWMTGGSLAQR